MIEIGWASINFDVRLQAQNFALDKLILIIFNIARIFQRCNIL
jgi:hypothetical protein